MPNYKLIERGMIMLAVDFAEQIIPNSFEFALNQLVDEELDLSGLDARFHNEHTGVSAYDPRVMLKIVLLAYSRGLISSRAIAEACEKNIIFIALSGDSRPSYTHIAKFIRELGDEVKPLFAQVLMTCDSMGLIGEELFAIEGVKLPSNASKERSGIDYKIKAKRISLQATREFVARTAKKTNTKADELKSDVTDNRLPR
jgi:transposase